MATCGKTILEVMLANAQVYRLSDMKSRTPRMTPRRAFDILCSQLAGIKAVKSRAPPDAFGVPEQTTWSGKSAATRDDLGMCAMLLADAAWKVVNTQAFAAFHRAHFGVEALECFDKQE